MAHEIIIDFAAEGDQPSVHRVRNFGEDLYRALNVEGWAAISLDDVDRATDQLRVTVFSQRGSVGRQATYRSCLSAITWFGAHVSPGSPDSGAAEFRDRL